MNNKEIDERLKELNIEDFIWIIYLIIILASYYSNHLERKYFKENDLKSREQYRSVIIGIFIVLVIVYSYFLYESYKDLKSLKPSDTDKKKKLVILSFIASLLILISGLIFLYIALKDEDLEIELAFN